LFKTERVVSPKRRTKIETETVKIEKRQQPEYFDTLEHVLAKDWKGIRDHYQRDLDYCVKVYEKAKKTAHFTDHLERMEVDAKMVRAYSEKISKGESVKCQP